MIDKETSLIDTSKVDKNITDLANRVMDEENVDTTKDLVAMFNWNISKKNVARLLKLNNILDGVSDQMAARVFTRPDQFSNSDLIDYMKAIQGAIDTSYKTLNQVEEPPVIVQQQNNTQINVNVTDGFDREAKERILAAVQSALKNAKSITNSEGVTDAEFVEIDTPNNENGNN